MEKGEKLIMKGNPGHVSLSSVHAAKAYHSTENEEEKITVYAMTPDGASPRSFLSEEAQVRRSGGCKPRPLSMH